MSVGVGDGALMRMPVTVKGIVDGGIEFHSTRTIDLEPGATRIEVRTTEYHPADETPFILSTMDCLTKDVRVEVHGDPGLAFDGDVIGLGDKDAPTPLNDRIRLEYRGWLLEDHGFVVFWWKK